MVAVHNAHNHTHTLTHTHTHKWCGVYAEVTAEDVREVLETGMAEFHGGYGEVRGCRGPQRELLERAMLCWRGP